MADDKHMTIDQAVAQVQRSVVVPKARYNAHGNYYYRSMEDIVAALKEPCRDAGVFFTLNDSIEQVGDRFYVKATCLVKFEDGTPGEIVICAYAREPLAQKGMSETQLTGSASSYARKYALCGMFDIDACAVAIGDWFRIVLLVVNILAVGIANTLNAQAACSRVLFSMGRDRLLPGALAKVHPKFRTPYVAILLIGVVSLACTIIFTDEQLTKLVNFGAISSFMMLNLAVIWFFFVKEQRRSGMDLVNYLVYPLAGTLILLYVWSGFDHLTQILGFSWLAVGIVFGYIKSKGYKEVPDAFKKSMM